MCTPGCIIEKLRSLAFDEAIKAGKYVLHYTKNLGKLHDKNRELGDRMEIITNDIREAINIGEEIKVDVSHWQIEADRLKDDIEQLIKESTAKANMDCIACSCPNFIGRYNLSKEAEEKIEDAKELTKKSHFEAISHPRPRPSELQSLSDKNYVDLNSRASIFKEIMYALKYSSGNMIGVYGLGGVGKTTLVKEVAEQMRKDKIFDQVAIAVVSKDLNVKEVQTKLAGSLNLKFKATADDQEGRATELWHKFTNGDKYLVILDNIWEMVKLDEIGIPISDGKRSCKVVLTSRMEDLLKKTMKADIIFQIAKLPEAEAWELFKKKVGNSILSQPEIYSLAREVCRKCKGLPLAINAIGAALQDKPDYAWNNALDKLNGYKLPQIEGIDPSVIASLRVSYDMLRSSDARSCFLLCCLFAEDSEIPIDELMRHCVARCLLAQNPRTLDEARNAVRTVVDALKSASLLTTGSHQNVVKIHGVLRNVGISIAHDEREFLIDHDAHRWPQHPTKGPSYSVISLNFKHMKEFPDGFVYPQLNTLMVDTSKLSDLEVPDNFFNGMTQLTVLTFTRMHMRRLPSSLAKLTNLRMLYLNGCKLEDIAILKDLKSNLEMLSLQGSNIKELPLEIAQLTNLWLLDLRDCDDLVVIPQGIIANLTNLEELYFPERFGKWEAKAHQKQDTSSSNNVSLEELRSLLSKGRLTTLHIHVPDVMLLAMEDLTFENLKRFRISVGSSFKPFENFPGTKVLKHEGSSLRNVFIPLVDKADVLYLSGMKGLKRTLHGRGVRNGFLDLKYLKVESCDDDLEIESCDDDLDFLFREPKLSVQSHGPHPLHLFNKLVVLVIKDCKSKYLFSPTIARGLVHLERLIVRQCKMMEAIVGFEVPDDENELTGEVKFNKLKRLELTYLPKLISMYAKGSSSGAQPLFNEKVVLHGLEIFKVEELDSIEEIWDKQSTLVGEKTASFGQLRNLTVRRCKKLMNLIPSNILPRMRNLQTLVVQDCPDIEFVVFKNEKEEEVVDIPQLRYLEISHMRNLKSFYSCSTTSNAQSLFNHQVLLPVLEIFKVEALDSIKEIWDKQSPSVGEKTVSFGQLKNLTVRRCKILMNLVPSYILARMRNLQTLLVQGCPDIEFVVFKNGKEEEEAADDDSTLIISQLRRLAIINMENLKSFYSNSTTSNAQSLFNHQVAFLALERFTITEVPKITKIWDKQPYLEPEEEEEEAESFCKLKYISVKDCKQLVYVFPSYMLPRLQNLQEIKIRRCEEMETIISKELEENEATNKDIIEFRQLKAVKLRRLPKLKSFYAGTQLFFSKKVAFPMLKINTYSIDPDLWFLVNGTSTQEDPFPVLDNNTYFINPDLISSVNGTSTKEIAIEELDSSSNDEDNSMHNSEEEEEEKNVEEDEEVNVKNDNEGEGEEKKKRMRTKSKK